MHRRHLSCTSPLQPARRSTAASSVAAIQAQPRQASLSRAHLAISSIPRCCSCSQIPPHRLSPLLPSSRTAMTALKFQNCSRSVQLKSTMPAPILLLPASLCSIRRTSPRDPQATPFCYPAMGSLSCLCSGKPEMQKMKKRNREMKKKIYEC